MEIIIGILVVLGGAYTILKIYKKTKITDKSKVKSNQSGSNVEGDQAGRDIIK